MSKGKRFKVNKKTVQGDKVEEYRQCHKAIGYETHCHTKPELWPLVSGALAKEHTSEVKGGVDKAFKLHKTEAKALEIIVPNVRLDMLLQNLC